jgi:predicted nucleotidyltransferase
MPYGLAIDAGQLADLCRRYHVATLELFGSRVKGTARPDSDVDLLVTFEDGQTPGLGFFGLALDLEALFGHPVDLFTRTSVEHSPNLIKRQSILATTERLYDRAA